MYEFTLQLDQFKSINYRTSTQVFEYLGDIGGFQSAFAMVFCLIGAYFSDTFYSISVASSLYTLKKKKSVIRQEKKEYLEKKKGKDFECESHLDQVKSMFTKLSFSKVEVMLEPIIKTCCPCKNIKSESWQSRSDILKKCTDKYENELEITKILTKIRDTYSMLRFLRTKDSKAYLRYNKDRAITYESKKDIQSESSETDSDTDSASSDADIGLPSDEDMTKLKESFRKLVVKGMKLDKNTIQAIQETVPIRSRRKFKDKDMIGPQNHNSQTMLKKALFKVQKSKNNGRNRNH